MEIKVTGVDREIARIRALRDKIIEDGLATASDKIIDDLVQATPIDTGRARAGWVSRQDGRNTIISNDVPYIEDLNNGHSKQAPSYFIEKVLLSHGKAIGAILTKTPD
jgi:hypothetical protein